MYVYVGIYECHQCHVTIIVTVIVTLCVHSPTGH